ncbi:hypothetical protein [Pseudonocardia sp. TRM90224]|uniref:hypothetical protein n=1 Tax=Pseudonocardia sp. TRM90224 TaxID=2812678 RepID=UPI001E62FB48|nr:hypothetical protein [Pseudonocardia sp. TRM90224]
MGEYTRPEFGAFVVLHDAAFRDGDAVRRNIVNWPRSRSMHKGCSYRVDTHTTAALGAGAVVAEIAGITFVGAGAAGAHGLLALR